MDKEKVNSSNLIGVNVRPVFCPNVNGSTALLCTMPVNATREIKANVSLSTTDLPMTDSTLTLSTEKATLTNKFRIKDDDAIDKSTVPAMPTVISEVSTPTSSTLSHSPSLTTKMSTATSVSTVDKGISLSTVSASTRKLSTAVSTSTVSQETIMPSSTLTSTSVATTDLSTMSPTTTVELIKIITSKSSIQTAATTNEPTITSSTIKPLSTKQLSVRREKTEYTSKWIQTTSQLSKPRSAGKKKVISTSLTSSSSSSTSLIPTRTTSIFIPQNDYHPLNGGISGPSGTTAIYKESSFGATALVLVVVLPFLTLFLIAIIIVLKKKCKKKSNKRKRHTKDDVEMDNKDGSQREPLNKPNNEA